MDYCDIEIKLSVITDGSMRRFHVKNQNFLTPNWVGNRKGVEISYGSFMEKWLVGVTFSIDNKKDASFNKCFHQDEIKEIASYIDESIDQINKWGKNGKLL